MTVKETIEEFLEKLNGQLEEHDRFLDQWADADWHERCVHIHKLLHGMWSTYEDAEDIADALKQTFPPYPFTEIRDIKRWVKAAIHKMDDFLEDEYTTADTDDYLSAYNGFLSKVCSDETAASGWHSHEQFIAEKERELLEMLNKSYSVLLDLMLSCYQSIQKDDETILLAYENCKARYEQLHWKRDREAFMLSLEKMFPWDEPTKMQLLELHQTKVNELSRSKIGRLYVENEYKQFVLEVAKLTVDDDELRVFFRSVLELDELDAIARTKEEGKEGASVHEGKKRGPREHYLFIDRKATAENTFIKNQEKFRFMQYIKAHNLSKRELSCEKSDKVNEILTCFMMQWMDRGLTEESPSGGAVFRFMTQDCGFAAGVTLDSYSNEMKERIRKKTYTIETYRSVAECFKKTNSHLQE